MSSLVLQQLVYRRRKVPVLFACVCSVEEEDRGNSYFAEQLLSWFHSKGRELLMVNRDNAAEVKIHLQEVISQIDEELAENRRYLSLCSKTPVSVAGMVCVGDSYVLFSRGSQKIYLLNYRFLQANCRRLMDAERGEVQENSKQLRMISGRMEQNIGLLLATADFGKGLEEAQIRECLEIKDLAKADACTQHLQELGQVSVQNGGQHIGAVLLVTV